MNEYSLRLPPPQYSRGHFHQWILPREQFPSDDFQFQLFPQIKWKTRGKDRGEEHYGQLAGLTALQKIQLLEDCPQTVLFDWRSFFNERGTDWDAFFQFPFPILPHISLFPGHMVLRHLGHPIRQFKFTKATSRSCTPIVLREKLSPDYEDWEEVFTLSQKEFLTTPLQKVVLSRKKITFFDGTLDHEYFWKKLQSFQDQTYQIMIRPQATTCFYSLTPERLFKKVGTQCFTEAMAGTGQSDLLSSEKDLYEHEVVIAGIVQAMQGFSSRYHRGKTEVVQLHHLQHLKTPLRFTLAKTSSPIAVRDALHPTPALGGLPKSAAQEFMQHHDSFDRGLYGAPIGRWTKQEQEYAVGIRSALALGNELHVFCGGRHYPPIPSYCRMAGNRT